MSKGLVTVTSNCKIFVVKINESIDLSGHYQPTFAKKIASSVYVVTRNLRPYSWVHIRIARKSYIIVVALIVKTKGDTRHVNPPFNSDCLIDNDLLLNTAGKKQPTMKGNNECRVCMSMFEFLFLIFQLSCVCRRGKQITTQPLNLA